MMTQESVPLSVCIITRNEEKKLPACLKSVQWADEVVVVDDFSTDATPHICHSFPNVHYFTRRFDGFGLQKRFAVTQAKYGWVLNLDADEVVTPELTEEIQTVIVCGADYAGYYIRRKNLWFNKYYIDGYPGALRLFNKSCGNFRNDYVHEKVEISGSLGQLEGLFLHHPASFESFSAHYAIYAKKYGKLAAQDYLARKKYVTPANVIWKIVLLPIAVFLKKYLFGRYFRRGKTGLIIAISSAMCYHIAYKEVLRLQRETDVTESDND